MGSRDNGPDLSPGCLAPAHHRTMHRVGQEHCTVRSSQLSELLFQVSVGMACESWGPSRGSRREKPRTVTVRGPGEMLLIPAHASPHHHLQGRNVTRTPCNSADRKNTELITLMKEFSGLRCWLCKDFSVLPGSLHGQTAVFLLQKFGLLSLPHRAATKGSGLGECLLPLPTSNPGVKL